VGGEVLEWVYLIQSSVLGPCVHDNKPSGSIKRNSLISQDTISPSRWTLLRSVNLISPSNRKMGHFKTTVVYVK
jgi:hypothetical protein